MFINESRHKPIEVVKRKSLILQRKIQCQETWKVAKEEEIGGAAEEALTLIISCQSQ